MLAVDMVQNRMGMNEVEMNGKYLYKLFELELWSNTYCLLTLALRFARRRVHSPQRSSTAIIRRQEGDRRTKASDYHQSIRMGKA